MASSKLLLGLTTGRRLRSRSLTGQLLWAANLPEATTYRSLAAATAAAQQLGRSPAALRFASRTISTTRPATQSAGDAPGPSAVDPKLIMPEDEFHKLADETIHDLLEKLEEYGESILMDGFDIDYGNQVLTFRLGDLGTYVVNKQAPNRQIWLSSPVSGPSRFDWDASKDSWIYKRTGANLVQLLEKEIGELCGTPAKLS